jgi:hypothetical protein
VTRLSTVKDALTQSQPLLEAGDEAKVLEGRDQAVSALEAYQRGIQSLGVRRGKGSDPNPHTLPITPPGVRPTPAVGADPPGSEFITPRPLAREYSSRSLDTQVTVSKDQPFLIQLGTEGLLGDTCMPH